MRIEESSELEHFMSFIEWGRKNKTPILWSGIGLALIVSVFLYISYHARIQTEKASLVYEEMLTAFKGDDKTSISLKANELKTNHSKTAYAQFANLALAYLAVQDSGLKEAEEHLKAAIDPKQNEKLSHVARIRLARVYLAENQLDEAWALLKEVKGNEYQVLYEEIKGDIHLAKGNKEEARTAYKAALEAAPEGFPVPWLDLKLSELGNL